MIKLKNVIFDIGNVLVRWDPYQVIKSVLKCDPIKIYDQMRTVWIELNLGKITEQQAVLIYQQQLNIPEMQIKQLLHELKTSQTLIFGCLN